MFKEVPTTVNFPELEHRIIKFWSETKAFQKLVELNKGKPKWSFMDGPITANNPMGVHHCMGPHLQGSVSALQGNAGPRTQISERLRLPGLMG